MTEDEFILRQCDWTEMSIFLILTGKSELILETERRKETQNYKININAPKKDAEKSWSHSKINYNLMKAKWRKCKLHFQQRSFLVKNPK